MVRVKVWRSGERLVVTLPAEEVERYGLREGQEVTLEVRPVGEEAAEGHPPLAPDLQESFERVFKKHEAALRYLADRWPGRPKGPATCRSTT